MYNSQYYTCEQIDERLLQGYLDDYNTQTGQSLTKAQFLTKLGSIFSKEGVIDNTATQIGYYECDTAAGTAAKTITVANYALFAGGSMKVKFANKNTANNATLNINSQGAKALYYQGERASATNSWDAEEVVEIYYDGTSYYANNVKGGSGSGVYDVSKEHPTSGPNSDGKFTLEYILNPSNVNELIPVNKRYPGMSIQFVSTSDNKYVQYRLMSDSFNTTVANWQGVDAEPTAGSDNLVKSGGIFQKDLDIETYLYKVFDSSDLVTQGFLSTTRDGEVKSDSSWMTTDYINVSNCKKLKFKLAQVGTAVCIVFYNSDKSIASIYSDYTDYGEKTISIPSGITYMRASMKTNGDNYQYLYAGISNTFLNKDEFSSFVNETKNKEINYDAFCFEITKNDCSTNGWIDNEGTIHSDSSWLTSPFIGINKYLKKVKVNLDQYDNQVAIVFYNSSKEIISTSTDFKSNIVANINVPSNTSYIRCCFNKNQTGRYLQANNFDEIFDVTNDNIEVFNRQSTKDVEIGYITVDGTWNPTESSSNWRTTNYLPVDCVRTLYICVYNSGNHVAAISFYNSNKEYIGYIGDTHTSIITINDYIIPTGAVYARITYGYREEDSATIYKYDYKIQKVQDEIDKTNNNVTLIENAITKVYKVSDLVSQGFLSSSRGGELKSDANWRTTDYVNVSANSVIKVYLAQINAAVCVVFYNSDKTILSYDDSYLNETPKEIAVPSNAVYMRASMKTVGYTGDEQYVDVRVVSTINKSNIVPFLNSAKVYTVCNDIKSNTGNTLGSRNYSAKIYIDHFFKGLSNYSKFHISELDNEKTFVSPYEIANSKKYINSTVNGEIKDVNTFTEVLDITGDIIPQKINITHVSTRNGATSNKHVRLLCIGDSVTAGSNANANMPYNNCPRAYWQWVQALFEMDKIENENSGFDCITLGNYITRPIDVYGGSWETLTKEIFDINMEGFSKSGITACACGYAGGTTQTWLTQWTGGKTNPFYDIENNKFSVEYFVTHYRTLIVNNDGTTTRCDSSNKGDLVTDVNAYNVCEPTHVLISLGYNQNYDIPGSTRNTYLADLQTMISTIQTEYPDAYILLQLPDTAGTYFPYLYPEYYQGGNAIYGLDFTKGVCKTYHDRFCFMTKDLMDLEDDENKVYFVPSYFVSPLVFGSAHRIANDIINLSNSDLGKYNVEGGTGGPYFHPNNAAHATWAYQIYSLIKYTLTLN